jgi:2-haloalkanoic acid dehalogenase type II
VTAPHFRAVLFDLLTGLLNSWSLWERVAGDAEHGRRWRLAYLAKTYAQNAYRPYEALVRDAAVETGLPATLADRLAASYGEIEPWPEVKEVLAALRESCRLAVVTNCSEALGRIAAARVGIAFDAVVTAERAGHYKPHARPYRLALDELGVAAAEALFVAGSAYDLFGANAVGLPVFWHDRIGMPAPDDAPAPLAHYDNLRPLVPMVLG